MTYPKRLGQFKKWAKAMEEGAVMDRPEYTGGGRRKRFSKTRRSRGYTRPRRTRQKQD